MVGQSHYSVGKKYCRRCECYFTTSKVFCECCGMQLRASPHCGRVYKDKVRATKKNELMEKVLVGKIELQPFHENSSIV